MKKGFTLIELLVVVLIIGILTAGALPQYKKAVVRARIARAIPLLAALRDAQKVYFLETGQYTGDIDLLNVQFPYTSKIVEKTKNVTYETPLGMLVLHGPVIGASWKGPGIAINFYDGKQECFAYKAENNYLCASLGPESGTMQASTGTPIYNIKF